MHMDPVVALTEELRAAEGALDKATHIYNRDGRQAHGELVNVLLTKVRRLFTELFDTEPTSALGAGELVRLAAQRMPFTYGRQTAQLHEIADRLSLGQRRLADLVFLRAMHGALLMGPLAATASAPHVFCTWPLAARAARWLYSMPCARRC